MNMEEARKLGEDLEKNLNRDFKKTLNEHWTYFKSLAENPDTPESIREYIVDHFKYMKLSDYQSKPPMYLIIDIMTIYDVIKLYDGESKQGDQQIKRRV